jgi:hypothetical protein
LFSGVAGTARHEAWTYSHRRQPPTAAPVYVTVQDSAGKTKTIAHPDPAATNLTTWQPWRISLSDVSAGGVKTSAVKKLIIGAGDRANPKADGAGLVFIDDIGVGHPAGAK